MGWFRRKSARQEAALAAFLDSPEGQEEMSRLVHVISAEPSELTGNDPEFRAAVDMRAEGLEMAVQDILPHARDEDPNAVEAAVARDYPGDVAAWVGYRVWETQLAEADEARVSEMAAELELESPNHVYHEAKRWRLLRECEKRGLPVPPGSEQFNDPVSMSMEERGLSPAVMAQRMDIVMRQLDNAARGG